MRFASGMGYHQSHFEQKQAFKRRGRYQSHVSNTAIRGARNDEGSGRRSKSPREDCTPPGALTSPTNAKTGARGTRLRLRGTAGRKPGQEFSALEPGSGKRHGAPIYVL